MQHTTTLVNSYFPDNVNLPKDFIEPKVEVVDFQGMRLSKLCWFILYEIYLITRRCKRDYGYTAQEISNRFKAKGRKDCCVRNIEEALQILQSVLFFVSKTTRKCPPQFGKEKFRGCYRELTDIGFLFIEYRFSERERIRQEKVGAELNAELNASQPYCHVASEPLSKINLKDLRSNLDSNTYIHSSERLDFQNACFEEYANQMSNAAPYIEQEVIREEIYEPVLPKHRPQLKKLLDESGLENTAKVEVIKVIVRQQNASTGIKNIRALTKTFIAKERVMLKQKIKSYNHASYKQFIFIEMTQEEIEKSKIAKDLAFIEMRKKLSMTMIN